jgi:hypothetical protein
VAVTCGSVRFKSSWPRIRRVAKATSTAPKRSKKQMYSRADPDLLRKRVLLATDTGALHGICVRATIEAPLTPRPFASTTGASPSLSDCCETWDEGSVRSLESLSVRGSKSRIDFLTRRTTHVRAAPPARGSCAVPHAEPAGMCWGGWGGHPWHAGRWSSRSRG